MRPISKKQTLRNEAPEAIDDVVLITRGRVYRRGGRFAWVWRYTVNVPGEPYPFAGEGIGWARDIARRKGGGRRVVEAWKTGGNR